jgi:beta-lactamase class C
MPMRNRALSTLACLVLSGAPAQATDAPVTTESVRRAVDEAVLPMMDRYGIPGLAVAVSIDGVRVFVEHGVASKSPRVAVTRGTIFELGSVSKTFTATLAAYAEQDGVLSLSDPVTAHVPELRGSALDRVQLLHLATHTAGGFPLQVPDEVGTIDQLMAYFRAWTPQFATGTVRTYANPSIGLLGVATARAMGQTFQALVEKRLFPELGLGRTYVTVPAAQQSAYAWGYDRADKPVRVNPGPLATEAYGIKSTAADMIRFVEVSMGLGDIPPKLRTALDATHVGYAKAGDLTQDLVWEQYPYPVALERIVAGNSSAMSLQPVPATMLSPPTPPRSDVIINKTGSTNGFGAYVAFVPAKKIGIVMLANKNYPNDARVTAALRILSQVAEPRDSQP